jgi:hypothetical protein
MMKKTILLLFLSMYAVVTASAMNTVSAESKADSTSKWKSSFKPGVTYSGTSFKNWFAGGNEIVTMKFNSLGIANYASDRVIWKNTLFMDYGFTKRSGQKIQVTVDKLDLASRLSLINSKKSFMYTALFGLKSQFTNGYNYLSSTQWLLQSSFFAPGYITLNFGVDYMKIKHLNIHISPISEKTTIVREAFYEKKVVNEYYSGFEPEFMPEDDEHSFQDLPPTEEDLEPYETALATSYESYGLAWRENTRFEVGAGVQFLYDNPELFKKYLGLKSRLDIFATYTQITKPDIDWETWLSININDYFAFNINLQLQYDYDVKFQENYEEPDGTPAVRNVPKLQFRNFTGFGISYTFK